MLSAAWWAGLSQDDAAGWKGLLRWLMAQGFSVLQGVSSMPALRRMRPYSPHNLR